MIHKYKHWCNCQTSKTFCVLFCARLYCVDYKRERENTSIPGYLFPRPFVVIIGGFQMFSIKITSVVGLTVVKLLTQREI